MCVGVCGVWLCVWVCLCVVVWHAENLRVKIQNASVRAGKTPVSQKTRAFGGTHGDVLNLHKEAIYTRTHTNTHEHRRLPCQTYHPKWATRSIFWFQRQCPHHTRMHVRLSKHTHTHHTPHTPHKHTQNTWTRQHIHHTLPHTQHFRQNRDNIDCRDIDHLALHKVQAMQLAKNMKTHNSEFWLRNEQHRLQSNVTAVYPRLFEILATLTFGALRKTSHCVNNISDYRKKTRKKQEQWHLVVHVWSAMYHEVSRTQQK